MIVIIGGGPAGRIASIHLADAGREVLLVEGGSIGGQCLHFGCMVVCALNEAARILHNTRDLRGLGIVDSIPGIDYPVLISRMQEVQGKIEGILDAETRGAGVEIRYGTRAHLLGNEVFIGEESIRPDAVIAATGSRPAIPVVPGIESGGVYTPHTLFQMKRLPRALVILGGGVMAAEFAYIFSSFGTEVHLVARSGVLKVLGEKQRAVAMNELGGVRIHTQTVLSSVNGDPDVSSVLVREDGKEKEIACDAVFVAAGLSPRSEELQGIQKGPLGEVVVDSRMLTSVPGVYAAGDVTGPPYLTPVARHEGLVAAENILGREARMDYRFFPQSVNLASEHAFCYPDGEEGMSVGMPGPAGPGTFWKVPFNATGISRVSVDPSSGEIGGVAASGPGAGIAASYIAFLMQKGYSAHDFSSFLEVHPETDGVHSLLSYLSGYLKKKGNG